MARSDLLPLTEDQRELVEANLGLAYAAARRVARRRPGDLEAATDGAIDGLIRAAATLDRTISSFSTYGTACSRYEAINTLRQKYSRRRHPAAGLVPIDDVPGLEPADPGELPGEGLDGDPFESLLSSLRARDREVIRMRFRDNLTLREVGDRLGLTRERIRQIEKKALARLRDHPPC